MTTGNPSSSHEIGTVADHFASADLRLASSVFEHRARAGVLMSGVVELNATDVQELMLFGPFACATPAFGKIVANTARHIVAARHGQVATRLSQFFRD